MSHDEDDEHDEWRQQRFEATARRRIPDCNRVCATIVSGGCEHSDAKWAAFGAVAAWLACLPAAWL